MKKIIPTILIKESDACLYPHINMQRVINSRKYSHSLLREANRLAEEIGVANAARRVGIPVRQLIVFRYRMRVQSGKPPGPGAKQARDPVVEQNVIYLAMQYITMHDMKVTSAFRKAGKKFGVDGALVHMRWRKGNIKV